jgi:iron(III) transport system ATP-binding protein
VQARARTHVLSLVPSHHDHALGERIGVQLAIDHVVAFPAAV